MYLEKFLIMSYTTKMQLISYIESLFCEKTISNQLFIIKSLDITYILYEMATFG